MELPYYPPYWIARIFLPEFVIEKNNKEIILDPIFTTNFRVPKLKKLDRTPFLMDAYSTRTQSYERAVQGVDKASEAVYEEDKSDG